MLGSQVLDVGSEFDISKTSKENTKDFDGSKSDFSKSKKFARRLPNKKSVERYYKGILLKISPDILQNLYYPNPEGFNQRSSI